jgi:hypothetical protein
MKRSKLCFLLIHSRSALVIFVDIYYKVLALILGCRSDHDLPCGRMNQLHTNAVPNVAARHTKTVCLYAPTVAL